MPTSLAGLHGSWWSFKYLGWREITLRAAGKSAKFSGTDLCRQALLCQRAPGHRANLYDLRVCLNSSSCLRPESNLTIQTVTIKLYFTISAFKSKQNKLKEPGIENSAVVAPAVVWRRLNRRTFENIGED